MIGGSLEWSMVGAGFRDILARLSGHWPVFSDRGGRGLMITEFDLQ
jgi:hypothetical protein